MFLRIRTFELDSKKLKVLKLKHGLYSISIFFSFFNIITYMYHKLKIHADLRQYGITVPMAC